MQHKYGSRYIAELLTPMSLQIVALFDEIAAGLEYYEVIDNTPTRESFSKVVERIKFLQ
jgi:hypothetical protein